MQRGGGPPLGHLKPPLGSMDTYIADKIISWPNLHMSRPSLCMLRPTLRVTRQNLAKNFLALRQFYYFLKIFSKFFGIFNGENTLFSKSAQKMVQFQKKNTLYFFHFQGGGGQDPKWNFPLFFNFFFEPFPKTRRCEDLSFISWCIIKILQNVPVFRGYNFLSLCWIGTLS